MYAYFFKEINELGTKGATLISMYVEQWSYTGISMLNTPKVSFKNILND
mgnify:CR=1 FL=1